MKIINALRVREENETEGFEIRVENGMIIETGKRLESVEGEEIYDAKGMLVTPGFVDIHVHLREPGHKQKETIKSGTRAAALGGYTTIVAMPNTDPVPDDAKKMKAFYDKVKTDALIKVKAYSAITLGEKGEALVEFKEMREAGALGFSDDGKGVQDAGMMYRAMKETAKAGGVITAHCEDDSMLFGGYIHEGDYAKTHQHKGIHSLSEDLQIIRDIAISEAAGCPYHICHMSTKGGVKALGRAKEDGIRVSGEVTPHHLLLSEEDLREEGRYKMNPPLRSRKDQEALIRGLRDGIIDCIATDHAPHTEEEKSRGLEGSAFGIVGLETSFPLLYTHLVRKGHLTLERLIDAMTCGPSKVMSLSSGSLSSGSPADLTFIDVEKEWVIRSRDFESRGKSTPFDNWAVKAKVLAVMIDGKFIVEGGRIIE